MFSDCLEKDVKKTLYAVLHGRLKQERNEMAVDVDVCFVKHRESQSLLLGYTTEVSCPSHQEGSVARGRNSNFVKKEL